MTDFASPPPQPARRLRRFYDQAAARSLLAGERFGPRGHRIRVCYRVPVPVEVAGRTDLPVLYSSARKRGRLGGLMACGCVWVCPVCAAKIAQRRALEVAQAVELHQAQGGTIAFLTLTVPHLAGDDLPTLLSQLLAAVRSFKSGKAYAVAMVGAAEIRSLEVTHGQNGWHPHVHALLFLPAGCDFDGLFVVLQRLWTNAAVGAGLVSPNRLNDFHLHGFRLDSVGLSSGEDASTVAEYLTKFGRERAASTWTHADELARGNVKLGRFQGRTPFQILNDYASNRTPSDGALFRDYAEAFSGRAQLRWSRGLKKRFAIEDLDDQALVDKHTDDMTEIGSLDVMDLAYAVNGSTRPNALGELLEVINTGDFSAVRAFVDQLWDEFSASVSPPIAA